MKRRNWFVMFSLLAAAAVMANSAWATPLYWYANGSTAGGGGTWSTTSSTNSWYNDQGFVGWTNANGDDAYFTSTAGSVALGSPITVHNMDFSTSGYTVSGNATNNITLAGTTPIINVSTGTATISGATLVGTAGLVKDGAGTLVWTPAAASSLTGGITVSNGTLSCVATASSSGVANGLFSNTNAITVNSGATFAASGSGGYCIGNTQTVTLNDSSTLSVNGGTSVVLDNLTMTNGTISGASTAKVAFMENSNWTVSGTSYVTAANIMTLRGSASSGTGTHPDWTITTTSGAVLTISSQILAYGGSASPAVNLVKAGSGTLILTNSSNNYYGSTTINAGTLSISSESNLGANPTNASYTSGLFNAGQLTLNGGVLQTTANVTIDDTLRGITIGSSGGTFSTDASTTLTIAGTNIITGSGALTKAGAGTLTLFGANTYTGTTTVSAGILEVAGSLANKTSSKNFIGVDADGDFSTNPIELVRKVSAGAAAYKDFGSAIAGTGVLASTADILNSVTTNANHNMLMQWRQRTTVEKNNNILASEVLNLTGMETSGSYTDKFVLQMKYEENELYGGASNESALATAGSIHLAWLDGGVWKNAILGNDGPNSGLTNVQGGWATAGSSTMTLGDWGVDTANNVVWAVINHNGQFAVVPEPGTWALLVGALLSLIAYAWRSLSLSAGKMISISI